MLDCNADRYRGRRDPDFNNRERRREDLRRSGPRNRGSQQSGKHVRKGERRKFLSGYHTPSGFYLPNSGIKIGRNFLRLPVLGWGPQFLTQVSPSILGFFPLWGKSFVKGVFCPVKNRGSKNRGKFFLSTTLSKLPSIFYRVQAAPTSIGIEATAPLRTVSHIRT